MIVTAFIFSQAYHCIPVDSVVQFQLEILSVVKAAIRGIRTLTVPMGGVKQGRNLVSYTEYSKVIIIGTTTTTKVIRN